MIRLIVRRLVIAVPVLFIATALTFVLASLAPGDAARTILGPNATEDQYQALRAQLHLNEPIWEQYGRWLAGAIHGDLGTSLLSGQPVVEMIDQRLAVTLTLVITSILLSALLGMTLGVVSAVRGGALGRFLDQLSALSSAVPQYWLALLLVAIFAVGLRLLPATGWTPFSQSPALWAQSLILPTIALAAGGVTAIAKQIRDSMLGTLQSDYILALRSVGISRGRVILVHAMRNASIPVLTVVGLIFVGTIGGTVLIEQIFSLPGMGALSVTSTLGGDIPVVQGVVLYFTVIILAANLLLDLAYGAINPKVRVS